MLAPLPEKLRPKKLEDVVGQDHLVGSNGFITHVVQAGRPLSIILWGPPGCGKTSLARLYAQSFKKSFHSMSAIHSGIADLKKLVKDMESAPLFNQGMVLFVDEIHRFNKAQQDAFLPYVEDGTITLIGATAENPSFYLNSALLSRVRVLTLNSLNEEALEKLLSRYESLHETLPLTVEARQELIALSQGDGRYLLNLVENIRSIPNGSKLNIEDLKNLIQKRSALFDKAGDQHYNLISALHKSVRGSDPDAALYWFSRMLEGGEEPLFLARRLIRMASEDIGLADPQALPLAIAARDAYEMLGSPEGELALAQVVVYLALAPKSNSLYKAYGKVRESASESANSPPPKIILNAPTKLMKTLDYGKDYIYDHDTPEGFSGQNYFPEGFTPEEYYKPVERGFEREMVKRLKYFKGLRRDLNRE